MTIFEPGFEAFCDEHAKQLAGTKDDPWLLGHFSDNELPFRPNILDLYLDLPKESHGFQATLTWWDAHRKATGGPGRLPGIRHQPLLLHRRCGDSQT